MPAGQPASPGSSVRQAFGSGTVSGSHAIASANRGVQHSMLAGPAHSPAVAAREP
jgi:hypothetical protein